MVHAVMPRERWTVRAALRALEAAQKPAHGTPAYSRFVNRPVGRQLAARAASLGWSPNAVSVASAACSLLAIVVLCVVGTSSVTGLVVAALLVLGYALDSADGQVARLTGTGSLLGEWLDHMIDCAKVTALHLAVAVHLSRFTELSGVWLLVPALYCLVANVLFFGMVLTDQLRRSTGRSKGSSTGSLSVLRSVVILPSDYGALCLVFLALGWPMVFLGLYSLMLVGTALLLAAALLRWWKLLRSLDRSVAS
jgi:phosphatidylglycerophosphate synthase